MSIYKMYYEQFHEPIRSMKEEDWKVFGGEGSANLKRLGGRPVAWLRTFEEEWWEVGVTEFPNEDAIQSQHELRRDLQMRFGVIWRSHSLFGHKIGGDGVIREDLPIYKAFMVRPQISGPIDARTEESKLADMQEAMERHGGHLVLNCSSIEQAWSTWGLEQWPDFQHLDDYQNEVRRLDMKYGYGTDAVSMLAFAEK